MINDLLNAELEPAQLVVVHAFNFILTTLRKIFVAVSSFDHEREHNRDMAENCRLYWSAKTQFFPSHCKVPTTMAIGLQLPVLGSELHQLGIVPCLGSLQGPERANSDGKKYVFKHGKFDDRLFIRLFQQQHLLRYCLPHIWPRKDLYNPWHTERLPPVTAGHCHCGREGQFTGEEFLPGCAVCTSSSSGGLCCYWGTCRRYYVQRMARAV
eukprot:Lithocolla_globosa_v1_NODE_139_length_5801_cov_6.461364.p2 type:complete len:211 gc:universal NODE_139_length_5801_cov_6.461364:2460-1828(-)